MKAKRFQLVEVLKPAAMVGPGTRLFFGDQPQLRTDKTKTVLIQAIESYDSDTLAVSPSGNTVATAAQLKNAVLVLNVAGYENLQFIPLARLYAMQGTGIAVSNPYLQFLLDNIANVDWTKSYLQFLAAPDAAIISYVIGVYYLVNGQ